jgi:hypothetical protein
MAKPFLPLVSTILMNILMVTLNLQSQIRDRETTLFELSRTHLLFTISSIGRSNQPLPRISWDRLATSSFVLNYECPGTPPCGLRIPLGGKTYKEFSLHSTELWWCNSALCRFLGIIGQDPGDPKSSSKDSPPPARSHREPNRNLYCRETSSL